MDTSSGKYEDSYHVLPIEEEGSEVEIDETGEPETTSAEVEVRET